VKRTPAHVLQALNFLVQTAGKLAVRLVLPRKLPLQVLHLSREKTNKRVGSRQSGAPRTGARFAESTWAPRARVNTAVHTQRAPNPASRRALSRAPLPPASEERVLRACAGAWLFHHPPQSTHPRSKPRVLAFPHLLLHRLPSHRRAGHPQQQPRKVGGGKAVCVGGCEVKCAPPTARQPGPPRLLPPSRWISQ
jgi:hypothetical protein